VYIIFVFAIIEFGHAQLVLGLLQSGCRNGARLGSMTGPTTAEVVARVNRTVGSAVDTSKVHIYVRDASEFDEGDDPPVTGDAIEGLPAIELASAEPRHLFVVRAEVAYNDIALLPMPFMRNLWLDAQSFMRHE
jgi:hypothetical protein